MTACGTGNSANGGSNAKPAAAGTSGKEKPNAANDLANQSADLVFYVCVNGYDEAKFMQDYGNEIQKKFPKYKLTLIPQKDGHTLENLVTTGQNIDILITSIGLTSTFLLTFDFQYDISNLIKKYNFDLTRLDPSTIQIQNQLANGGIYGLPVSTTSAALFYNKDLFDKFAVAYPKDGMTWDDVYELAKKMTREQDGVQYKGIGVDVQHLLLLNQYSAAPVDPKTYKAQFTTDEFKNAFENLARFLLIPNIGLVKNKYTMHSQQDPFFQDKNLAMMAGLSTDINVFKDLLNWDMVSLPYVKDKPGIGPQAYPNYFYITKSSKNKDAAFQVAAYVTSDEFQKYSVSQGNATILKDRSVMKDFGKNTPYLKNINLKAYLPEKFANPTVKTKYQADADKEMQAALQEYVLGHKDLNTALREASERLDQTITGKEKK
jgi:multiple sugar transport system substrate-binding protein